MEERINCFTLLVNFKVKVGARGMPSVTRECNDLRFSYKLAGLNKQVITVCIKCNKAIAMIQAYSLSISTFPSWPCYLCIMQHDNVTIKRSQMQEKQQTGCCWCECNIFYILETRTGMYHVQRKRKLNIWTKKTTRCVLLVKKLQSRKSRVLDLLCHWLKQSPLCLAQGLYRYHYESTNAHLQLNIHMSATNKQLPGSGRKKEDGQGKKWK